jgi:hypothetical protein
MEADDTEKDLRATADVTPRVRTTIRYVHRSAYVASLSVYVV